MKYAILFWLSIGGASVLCAQEKGWSLGAYVFGGQSKFTFIDAPTHYTPQLAYQIGVLSQYSNGKALDFRLGLGYSSARGGYEGHEPDFEFPGLPPLKGDSYQADFERSDLVLPMELGIDFGRTPGSGWYALLGGRFDVKLTRKAEKTTYSAGFSTIQDLSNDHNTRRVDLSGTVGIGYAFPVNAHSRLYVQPTLSTNIPGNVFDFLQQDKGGAVDNITVYQYGLCLGWTGRL